MAAVDVLSDNRTLGLQQRSALRNLDRLRDLAYGQRHRNRDAATTCQLDVLLDGFFETGCFHRYGVDAGLQKRTNVFTVAISGDFVRDARGILGNGYFRVWNHGALRVGDGSEDGCQIPLRERGHSEHKNSQQRLQSVSVHKTPPDVNDFKDSITSVTDL